MELLRALNEQRGITIVMVTHEPDIARAGPTASCASATA